MHYTYAFFVSHFVPRFVARLFLSLSVHDTVLFMSYPSESPPFHHANRYMQITSGNVVFQFLITWTSRHRQSTSPFRRTVCSNGKNNRTRFFFVAGLQRIYHPRDEPVEGTEPHQADHAERNRKDGSNNPQEVLQYPDAA